MAWFGKLNAYDASATDGLVCKGYTDLVSDGQYIYFSPYFDGSVYHGRVLRLSIYSKFNVASSWEAYDAGAVDGLGSKGFSGAIFDGQFIYFIPYYNGVYHGIVLRYDTHKPFKSSSSWEAYNAGSVDGLAAKGFQGAVFDGQFIYFVPCNNGAYHGIVLRYDTQKPFKSAGSWQAYDAGASGGVAAKGYYGGVVDEDFIYFSPNANAAGAHGFVLRYERRLPFKSASAWSVFNATTVHADCKGFGKPSSDENFIYFPPSTKSRVLRYDKKKPFSIASSWESFDLLNMDGDPDPHDACFFSDHYVLFSPNLYDVVMYDKDLPFGSNSSWTLQDVGPAEKLDIWGYRGALADPNYFYFAPYRKYTDLYHGTVLRVRLNPCPGQTQPKPGNEDLTNYAEDDRASVISKSSTRATASGLNTGLLALCYQDYGADAFDEVEIDFDLRLNAASCSAPNSNEVEHGVLSLSNKHSSLDASPIFDDPIVSFFAAFSNGTRISQKIRFRRDSTGSSYAIAMNTNYYCKLLRSAGSGTMTLKIYSNAARTALLTTLTQTGFSAARKWRYIYAIRSGDLGPGDDSMSYYIENINVIKH